MRWLGAAALFAWMMAAVVFCILVSWGWIVLLALGVLVLGAAIGAAACLLYIGSGMR